MSGRSPVRRVTNARLRRPLIAGTLVALGFAWMAERQPAAAAWPPPPDAIPTDLQQPGAWPNDPLFGYVANADPAERREGQWELYSFVPERSTSETTQPSTEVASGSSVDLAWRGGTGNPEVVLAIASAGLDWSEPDLFEQIALNRGELRAAPPLHADATPCAPLDPSEPALDRFDCNGDGRLTLADYAEHPGLEPATTDPPGDANGNLHFDPQDLLRQPFLLNTIDDDGNGYVDDIAGWDFWDGDNDPFDPTGSGVGTREALAAAAETNNGLGGAGVCPGCRLLPLRVVHTPPLEPHALALATVYATERGARVLGVPGETWGISSLLDQALDYAQRSGTLVVGETGSTLTPRPALLGSHRHVLGLGAVTLGGAVPTSTTASTFLAASACSGFGAHRALSVPARTCPASVVGLTAGVAGLLVSAGMDSGLEGAASPLTASELALLLTTTSEDVDVIESREENSTLAWSQPGFDQHFGYGRLNANRATQAVWSGAIPPVVELASPDPFTTLYADRINAPVPIQGKISAKRAESYDYVVEWARGVEPLETAFAVIAEGHGLLASVVTGDEGELGEIDIRSLDELDAADASASPNSGATKITIRVRATAHYSNPGMEASSERRRVFSVRRDPDVVAGFPLRVGSSIAGGPKLADIDGDEVRDLVVATADGEIQVWKLTDGEATPAPGFPALAPRRELPTSKGFDSTGGVDPSLARESFAAPPAVGDLDGDSIPEIVGVTTAGTLIVVDHLARRRRGWPQRLPLAADCQSPSDSTCVNRETSRHAITASPVLEDLDGDGELEIIQAGLAGQIHVFTADGNPVRGWPVQLEAEDELGQPALATPTVVDLNGDGRPDLVVPVSVGSGTSTYVAIDGRGTRAHRIVLQGWPLAVVDWPLGTAVVGTTPASASAADFSGDGQPEIVLQGNLSEPFIVPAAPGPQQSPEDRPEGSWPVRDPATGVRGIDMSRFGIESDADPSRPLSLLLSRPSIGDLDQDGTPDVVTSGASRDVSEQLATGVRVHGPGEFLLAFWSGRSGAMFPGSPKVTAGSPWYGDAAIADISGDGYPEVISGTDAFVVHAVDACGRAPGGWPKTTGQWVAGSPAVGDLDGDNTLEIVVTTRHGWLLAWHTQGHSDGTIAWESQHHDNRNTGSLATKLRQGEYVTAPRPLVISVGGRCIPTSEGEEAAVGRQLTPAGGCGCGAASPAPRDSLWWFGLGALGALRRRRTRARRSALREPPAR